MFNILMPMAGEGTRTRSLSPLPKPIIKILDKPIFEYAASAFSKDNSFTFIVKKEHNEKFGIFKIIESIYPKGKIIQQEGKLDGAALSCMLAKDFLYNDIPLITCDSDVFVRFNKEKIKDMLNDGVDIIIITSKQDMPLYSYIKKEKDLVTAVFEKVVVSDDAISGIIVWKTGKMFFDYLQDMINNNIKIKNEFYISPAINQAILDGKIVKNIESEIFYHLGDISEIKKFKDKAHDIYV